MLTFRGNIALKKVNTMGFPGGAVVESLPANAGDTGSSPGLGRSHIPHATEQLGLWAITTEPARLEPVLRSKRGRDSERPAHRDEEWPPLAATRESPRTETKTQHTHTHKSQHQKDFNLILKTTNEVFGFFLLSTSWVLSAW